MLGGPRKPLLTPKSQRIGGQWRENEVLPENPHSGRTVSRPDVWPIVTRWTYALEPRSTVDVRQGNPIFTYRPITLVSLF